MAKAKARVSDAASDVHAQIRETVQAIDALWTTRVVISLEEEARTQDDHDARSACSRNGLMRWASSFRP